MNINQFNAFSGADRVEAKPIYFRQNFLLCIDAQSKTLNKHSSCKDWSFTSFIMRILLEILKLLPLTRSRWSKKKKKKIHEDVPKQNKIGVFYKLQYFRFWLKI